LTRAVWHWHLCCYRRSERDALFELILQRLRANAPPAVFSEESLAATAGMIRKIYGYRRVSG
jgi:hypothetical protein